MKLGGTDKPISASLPAHTIAVSLGIRDGMMG